MSTVYGPVPSWRFGRSLGIDVITPPKKCTFDCVYCQLGKTVLHVCEPEMLGEKVGVDRVSKDLDSVLGRIDLDSIDVVTFSGTGEPTLNLELGRIVNGVKGRMRGLSTVILTNSSLLNRRNIRDNLSAFDMVVAKLDAGDDETLRSINRPADKSLTIETLFGAIKEFKKEFDGSLALEVMLLSSIDGRVTNTKDKHLENLLKSILDVKPNIVQLEVPYRPPSEGFVRPPSKETLRLVYDQLSGFFGRDKLWVYGYHDRRARSVSWRSHKSVEGEAIELMKRRPCRDIDVSASLGISLTEAQELLRSLEVRGLIIAKMPQGEVYYSHRETEED